TLWPGKILNVRYENLVTDPQGESRRIFDYLGLEHSDHLVDIQNNKTLTTTASSMQVRESIHSRNVAGWKTYADYLSGLRSDLEAEIIAYEQS
ncbi:MAG TPA: sulfotransferase, partial [Arenimonas sp.]|nr:sulfotransferase [Arenimonas sp.]